VKFGVVGTIGFAVDTALLYLLMLLAGFGPYSGRLISYLGAATTTWALNRYYTFRGSDCERLISQWIRFISVNAGGGLINYCVYTVLVASTEVFASYPVLAVAAGSLAGLAFNFTASRSLVFRI
jgi:putative flippase GtrA